MTEPHHPDDELDELASAYLDDVATDAERARVEADPALQARVDALAQVRAAVRGLDLRVDPATREATIAAALDALTAEPPAALPIGRTSPVGAGRRLRYLAVAAAVAAAILAVPLLERLDSGEQDQSAASLDASSEAASDAAGGGARDEAQTSTSGAATGAPYASELAASDLGAFDDLAGLADAARQRLAAAPSDDGASAVAADGQTTTSFAPCAEPIDVPADATVLTDATATLAGDPVLVVVYRSPGGEAQLLVLDAGDCSTRSVTAL